jgi:hypothetical protein
MPSMVHSGTGSTCTQGIQPQQQEVLAKNGKIEFNPSPSQILVACEDVGICYRSIMKTKKEVSEVDGTIRRVSL